MAFADFNRIKNRVTETLNSCAPGSFSSTIDGRNKTRNAAAIEAACLEAALAVAAVLASTANEYRSSFVTVSAINHAANLPEHLGETAKIEIQRFSGADWREADTQSKSYQQIEAFRASLGGDYIGNIYDSIPHNEKDSTLAGYADIWENKFYFTGFAARIGTANIVRSEVAAKIPETFESTVIKLAVGNCAKAGDGAYSEAIAARYRSEGQSDLAEFKTGRRAFAEVSAPAPTKQVHE